MKKRILSFLLCVVMLVGMLPTTALAADNVTVTVYLNNAEDVYGQTATVTIAGKSYTGTVNRSWSFGSYAYYVRVTNATASEGDAITVSVGGYSGSDTISRSGRTYSSNVTLAQSSGSGTLAVTVVNSSGNALTNALVSFNDQTKTTDSSGQVGFDYSWDGGESFDVVAVHPTEGYQAVETITGGTTAVTVMLSEPFYYKFSDDSSNSKLYYTIDGKTLVELEKGAVLKLDRYAPVSFYTYINPGYTSGSTFSQRSGENGYSSSWISGTYTAIASAPDAIGSYDISQATAKASEMGCDFQFHYSATGTAYRYREFRVVSESVSIAVEYDPNGGRLNGSTQTSSDGNYYRHPAVTDAAYASYLTQITVPDTIPVRSGYTFAGWAFNGGIYRAGDTLQIEDLWSSEITTEVTYTFVATWTQDPGTLKISKTFSGPEDLPDGFHLTVTGTNGYSTTLLLSDASKVENSYIWTLDNLIAGVSYTVIEDGYIADGYTFDSASSVISGTKYIAPGQEAEITLVNSYTVNTYTVTWENDDGTVLETDTDVAYGTMPSYDGDTPTKNSDAQNTYVFSGWSPAVSPVSGNVTYTAVYTAETNSYTITWTDEDGIVLEKDENVPYGTMPSYDGEPPTKASTAEYHYSFSGWTPTVSAVTGDATYKATFYESDRYYTVEWLNHNKIVLETDAGVKYGTMIDLSTNTSDYSGAVPTKAADADYTYEFAGWAIWEESEHKDNPITGNTSFIATFTPVPIPRTATVEVVLNGSFDADDNRVGSGVNTDIEDLVSGSDGKVYLLGTSATEYLTLARSSEGVYSLTGIANGSYHVYLKVNGSYVQVGSQELTISNADRTRYLPYYSISYVADGAANVPETSYHYTGDGATLSSMIPTKDGALFTGWKEGTTIYTPGATTGSITTEHILTAQWQDAAKVNLTVVVDHTAVSDSTNIDSSVAEKLSFHISRIVSGSYVSIHDTAQTVSNWYNPENNVTTYTAYTGYQVPAVSNPTNSDYSGFASLDGYRLMSMETVYDSVAKTYNVTVKLQYTPTTFDLHFDVVMAEGTPASLIPDAVDVAVTRWNGSEWASIPGYENRTIEVTISQLGDGSYGGTGHFAAWADSEGTPYYYRIAVVDVDLPGTGHFLSMSGNGVNYSSTADDEHPAGAYTAVVTVTGGGTAPADGAYYADAKQNGSITATVTAHPYDILLDADYEGGTDTTIADRFTVPAAQLTSPSREGYTFGGWYTKQNGAGTKVIGGEHIKDLSGSLAAGGILTLYAYWKADITVTGTVYVDLGFSCEDDGRTVNVALQTHGGDGAYYETVQDEAISITLVDGETYATGSYTFSGVPDTGMYRVNLILPGDGNITYQNELSTESEGYTAAAYTAVDSNADGTAVVNIHLWPDTYDLGYLVDVSDIGEGFRPTSVTLDLRHDHRDADGALDGYEVLKHLDTVTAFGTLNKISVPRNHANGRPYGYVVSTVSYVVPFLSNSELTHTHTPTTADEARPFAVRYTGPANYSATLNADGLHQDVTLKAIFEPNHYTINYDLAGGEWAAGTTPVALHIWSHDTVIGASPIRDGYTFAGWEADVDGAYNAEKNAINAAIWETVTLTAKWTPVSYNISYDLDGGTLAEGVTNPATYTVADSFTLNNPSREGYTFAGWTGTGLAAAAQTVIIPTGSTGDRSYTATWTINSYDITIEVENGRSDQSSPVSVQHGDEKTIIFTANDGYALESVTVDGETAVLTGGSYTFSNVQGPHTITVVYATDVIGTNGAGDGIPDIHQATVTYRVVNGSFADGFASSVVFTLERYNENGLWEPVSPAPTLGNTVPSTSSGQMIPNTGYDGTGSWNHVPQAATAVIGDAVYRWTFTGISSYTVTYADHSKYQSGQTPIETSADTVSHGNLISINPNGGTWEGNSAAQYQNVTSDITLSDPTRENYVFTGWESKASSAADIAYSYTAQWKSVAHTISYELDGGMLPEGADNPTSYTLEDSFTLNNPEKTGYSFAGWTGTGLTDATMTVTIPAGSVGNREYTANWSINSYTVTWVDEDGTTVLHTDSVEYDAAVPSYDGTAPSKAASAQYTYAFAGWALSTDENNTILDLTDAKVAGDVTYKAVYTPTTNSYTVIWKDHDGTELERDENVQYGTTPTFDKEGGTAALAKARNTAEYTYTFAGWDPAVDPVTGDATYTATYTNQINQYTVTWADYDGSVLKTESVDYGTTPAYGGTPTREPDSQNSYAFKEWLDKESKLSEGKVVCDVTLTADYTFEAREFTGRVELYLEVGGSDVLTNVETLLGSGVKLYFSADQSSYYELSGNNGVYSNSTMPNGNYKLYSSADKITYSKVCDQTLVIYGGAATAKEYFHAVTYAVNGGSDGPVSPAYYHEGNGVTVSETIPTLTGYLFEGWWCDADGDSDVDADELYQSGDTLTSGIYQNYTLTAQWKKDIKAKVNLTITVNHSLPEGTNPNPGGDLKIDLTHREVGTDKNYVEVVGESVTKSNWYTANSATTELTYNDIFTELSGDYEYSVNVFLEHYQVSGTPTITPVTDDDGNVTYNISIALQYNPDLFNLSFTVKADDSVPAEMIPTAVDVKILAWDANDEGTWAPISRHTNSTMEVLLISGEGTGSYNVPVHKTGDSHYYYNVEVAGFTLPDGTELSAVTEDYVKYTSVGNSTSPGEAATYVVPLYYGDGAYYATVSISFESGETSEIGAYGHSDDHEPPFHQHGDITVTVFISRYDVELNLNYDGTDADSENDVLTIIEDQFRIPADIQTNAAYQPTREGYSFEGWYTDINCTDGNEALPGTVLTQNVTLYAKWKSLLTVSGNIAIAGDYTGGTIYFADRPASVIVTLFRKAPGSSHFVEYGMPVTVTIDNGTESEQKKPGVGTYEFANLPNDGSSYYITVLARNFTETFWNANLTTGEAEYDKYTATSNTAVYVNGSTTATVHAYLSFTPQTFDLDWEIDASAIGEDFRPTKASTLVICDSSPAAGYTWAVITQQIVNGEEVGQESSFNAGISTEDYDVWQYHSLGHAYNYAIRLQSITYKPDGSNEASVTDFTNAPFGISYVYPAFYKSTINDQDILLTATLTPKTYNISYDLGENGTWGSTTPVTSHTWSKATDIIGTPVRDGYVFDGWDSEAYDEENGQIKASVHRDVTLTAKWIKIEGVVFTGESGSVTYNGTEQSLSGITVSGLPAGYTYSGLTYSAFGTVAGNYEGSFSGTVVIKDGDKDVTDRFAVTMIPGTLAIGKAELTVTADNESKTYDGLPFTDFGYSVTGFVGNDNSDAISGSVSYTGSAVDAVDAASYIITPDVSGLSATNYSFKAVSGTLTISKAELTVKAVDKYKVYDGQPFTGFTYSLSGFVKGENASVLSGSVSYGGEAVNATAAGSYTINPNVDALSAVNYSFKVFSGTLTIAPDENGNGVDDNTETKYSVTYKKAANTDMAADVVHDGILSGLPIPAAPEVRANIGYEPGGWTLKEGTVGSDNTLGTSDLVYELTVSPCTYSITYDLDGGTNAAGNPTNYTYGVGVSAFADAEKQGHVFQGWYSDRTFANKVENISSTSTDAVTLYAKWAADGNGDGTPDSQQKKVTFVVVNGTWGGSGTEKTLYVDLDASGNGTIALPIDMEPNSGYANGVWDGGTPSTAVTGTDEVVYTYRYTVISGLSYTVHYLEKGTNNALETQKIQDGKSYGDTVRAEDEKITITGYVYDSASAETLTIGTDSDSNVLNLYYVKDATQTKTLSYTVKHLLDGVEQSEETKVYEETVWVNNPDTLTVVAGSLDAKSFAGYRYEQTENAPDGAVIADGTVVVLYYTKLDVPLPPAPPVSTTGIIVLNKVDSADNSTKLSNVVFELYSSENGMDTLLGTYTTDANGQITVVDLDAGKYYWLELRAQEGYMLDHNKHPFTLAAGQTETITITNARSAVPDVFSGDHYAYIIGYSDGLVHPEAKITRAEVATIFFRLLDDATRERYITRANAFPDVEEGMWFNTAVSTMAAMGIINGYPDGNFHPNEYITRAEFAAIAARFDKGGNTTGVSFSDIYGHWAQREINIAANNGWILGYEDGTFRPNQQIVRAEAIAMVNRVLQRIPEHKDDLLDSMVIWPDNMDTTKWYYLSVQEATNSHDYSRKTNGYEYWTDLREVRDWAALER